MSTDPDYYDVKRLEGMGKITCKLHDADGKELFPGEARITAFNTRTGEVHFVKHGNDGKPIRNGDHFEIATCEVPAPLEIRKA